MQQQTINFINSLPQSERFELIDYLVTELAEYEDSQGVELSDAQKAQLDEDYAEYLAHPDAGEPWEEIKAEMLSKFCGFNPHPNPLPQGEGIKEQGSL